MYPHIRSKYMPAAISSRIRGELFNVNYLARSGLGVTIDAILDNLTNRYSQSLLDSFKLEPVLAIAESALTRHLTSFVIFDPYAHLILAPESRREQGCLQTLDA